MSNEKIESCPSFEGCKAPLCPLDDNLKYCIWLPGEDICVKRGSPDWVKKQRKIDEVVGKDTSVGYFDVSRLNEVKKARHGIKGCNPNKKV